jgi:hypothetical protein
MIQGETEPTQRNKENPLDLIDEQHLDEDEQEAIIEKFENDFRFNSKIFRVFIFFFDKKSVLCVLSGIFGFLFFFLGYIRDDFSEDVSGYQAQLVHFATGFGFFLQCYSVLYSKTKLSNESEAEKGGYIDQEKVLEFENAQAVHFKIFIAICFLATFEIILFFPFAYSSFMLRKQFGYFNTKLILFPLLLPIFTLLSFISFRIMESMKNDIRDLEGKKYHFKKL